MPKAQCTVCGLISGWNSRCGNRLRDLRCSVCRGKLVGAKYAPCRLCGRRTTRTVFLGGQFGVHASASGRYGATVKVVAGSYVCLAGHPLDHSAYPVEPS